MHFQTRVEEWKERNEFVPSKQQRGTVCFQERCKNRESGAPFGCWWKVKNAGDVGKRSKHQHFPGTCRGHKWLGKDFLVAS